MMSRAGELSFSPAALSSVSSPPESFFSSSAQRFAAAPGAAEGGVFGGALEKELLFFVGIGKGQLNSLVVRHRDASFE